MHDGHHYRAALWNQVVAVLVHGERRHSTTMFGKYQSLRLDLVGVRLVRENCPRRIAKVYSQETTVSRHSLDGLFAGVSSRQDGACAMLPTLSTLSSQCMQTIAGELPLPKEGCVCARA